MSDCTACIWIEQQKTRPIPERQMMYLGGTWVFISHNHYLRILMKRDLNYGSHIGLYDHGHRRDGHNYKHKHAWKGKSHKHNQPWGRQNWDVVRITERGMIGSSLSSPPGCFSLWVSRHQPWGRPSSLINSPAGSSMFCPIGPAPGGSPFSQVIL